LLLIIRIISLFCQSGTKGRKAKSEGENMFRYWAHDNGV